MKKSIIAILVIQVLVFYGNIYLHKLVSLITNQFLKKVFLKATYSTYWVNICLNIFKSSVHISNYIENTEISVVCTWDLCSHVQTIHYVQILLTYLGLGRLQATGTWCIGAGLPWGNFGPCSNSCLLSWCYFFCLHVLSYQWFFIPSLVHC